GRAGDAPVVATARRRVRAQAMTTLVRALAPYPVLAAALGESAIGALLIDAARGLFRHGVRTERELARWAMPPTGTSTRERAFAAFADVIAAPADLDALDRVLAEIAPAPPAAAAAPVAAT